MNSQVIKFVAGGGKTTHAIDVMSKNKGGLYLAFTNSVVNDARESGHLSLTIDSLFMSFLIPKLLAYVPLAAVGSKVESISENDFTSVAQGAKSIKIDASGVLSRGSRPISDITLMTSNSDLHIRGYFTNSRSLKHIFGKKRLRLYHTHTEGIALFLMDRYGDLITGLLKSRFAYIIVDEAQDLKGYRERFARLLYETGVPIILLGDSYQNVNGGGKWFEELPCTETKNISHRCTEGVCKWIRDNLGIEIYGRSEEGSYAYITLEDARELDDGRRTLLYKFSKGQIKDIVGSWRGPKDTIQSAKGRTINTDVVIVGITLNHYNLYTAATRTTKSVFSAVQPARETRTIKSLELDAGLDE